MPDAKDDHELVRFSRRDLHDLDRLPSANPGHAVRGRGVRLLRRFGKSIGWAAAVVGLSILAAVAWLGLFGISSDAFSRTAENLVQSLAGPKMDTGLQSAELALDSSGNLAFRGSGLFVGNANFSGKVAEVRIGLKTLGLLRGAMEVGEVEADGVDIVLPSGDVSFWDRFRHADGLVSPAGIPSALADAVETIRSQLSFRDADAILLKNVRISRENSTSTMPVIRQLLLKQSGDDGFLLSGEVEYAGLPFSIDGELRGPGQYLLSVKGASSNEPAVDAAEPPSQAESGLTGRIVVAGSRIAGRNVLRADADIDEFAWTSKRKVRFSGKGLIRFELRDESEKVEVLPSRIEMGANLIGFSGAAGLSPETRGGYRFELVSTDSRLQPADSPEPGMPVGFRLAGAFEPETAVVRFTDMALRTLGGDVIGQGDLRFAGGSPEMIFGIRIPKLKIADAKQLWPAIIAAGARNWVLDHVYGGTLTDSRIDVTFKSGYFNALPQGVARVPVTVDQVSGDFNIENARFDVIGDLPPVRNASGKVEVRGGDTFISVTNGTAYLENGATADIANGTMSIPYRPVYPVMADLAIDVIGNAQTIAELASRKPINALQKAPVTADDVSGQATARISATFPLVKAGMPATTTWKAAVDFSNLSIAKDFNGQKLTDADGTLNVDQRVAAFSAKGKLNGIPAEISLTEPIEPSASKRTFSAWLKLDDDTRSKLMPGLNGIVDGGASVEVTDDGDGSRQITADLKSTTLSLPWAGWSKGSGVPAKATFRLKISGNSTTIDDFELKGETFRLAGSIGLEGGSLAKADFSTVRLNRGDDASVSIRRSKGGYDVSVNAKSLDLRGLLKRVLTSFETTAKAAGSDTVRVSASIGSAAGFGSERLQNLEANYVGKGSNILSFAASAATSNGGAVTIRNRLEDGRKTVQIETADGGALLRFLDYYDKMSGGQVSVSLSSTGDGPLSGEIDARNFLVVGEPRLKSLVGSPVTPDGQSLASASNKQIDVSRVKFQRGNAIIEKGSGYLKLAKGILRSDQIGLSYEGTLYDKNGRIDMTGTFLPAYGLNRIFGEIPIIGEILGNGRDKGLIGITFKLSGPAKSPQLLVNPISLVAPGIFRQIFEFQ